MQSFALEKAKPLVQFHSGCVRDFRFECNLQPTFQYRVPSVSNGTPEKPVPHQHLVQS